VLDRLGTPGADTPLTVLVIEDVHWADDATLDLLRFIGRRLRGRRALVLATYRDDALGPADALRTVVGELTAQRSTRRISLAVVQSVAARAPIGEVWATSTLRDLAAGSGLAFETQATIDVPSLGRRIELVAAVPG
jgi:predicted ATPase